MGVERLTAGQAFHRTVQSAFLTGLAGGLGVQGTAVAAYPGWPGARRSGRRGGRR